MMDIAVPFLAGALVFVVLWDIRHRTAQRHTAELRHLQSSKELFEAYAKALEEFLQSKSAPMALKRLLISYSDVLSDRKAMVGIAELLCSGRKTTPIDDDKEVLTQIDDLRKSDPDLMRTFASAVITGTMSSLLRWPETAPKFETISARLFSDPKQDVSMAVTASRLRKLDLPFRAAATESPAMA